MPHRIMIPLTDAVTIIRQHLRNAENRHKTRMKRQMRNTQPYPQAIEVDEACTRISLLCYEIHDEFKKIKKLEAAYEKEIRDKPYKDSMAGRNRW